MQNSAVYNPSFNSAVTASPAANTPWMPRSLRTLARKWDFGVLGLMASSAAYGVFALASTGF